MKPTIKVEYTEEEAQALLRLIDVAIKATGLGGAEAGVVLARKLNDAAKAAMAPQDANVAAPNGKGHGDGETLNGAPA